MHVPLTITNTCALPQKLFRQLTREISVPEDDGFGTLLPNETIVRNVVFSPVAAIPVKLKLKMCTFWTENSTSLAKALALSLCIAKL